MLFFAMRFCALRCVSLPFIRVFQLGKRPIAKALAALLCYAVRCLAVPLVADHCGRVFQLGKRPIAKALAALPCSTLLRNSVHFNAIR